MYDGKIGVKGKEGKRRTVSTIEINGKCVDDFCVSSKFPPFTCFSSMTKYNKFSGKLNYNSHSQLCVKDFPLPLCDLVLMMRLRSNVDGKL